MLNIKRIDEFLSRLEAAVDDNELRGLFATYNAEYDLSVPPDPTSKEYRDFQFNIYEQLAKKKYYSKNEVSSFNVESAAISPFPYCHGSPETVGNQLMAIGFVIKSMQLPKNATLLELGAGWGNTTIALAKMGIDVTAVDIEKNFCDLITARAKLESLSVRVINAEFNKLSEAEGLYDAILFFECFHHADDHLALIAKLGDMVKPGGLVCFGAEPITNDFPLPWGLRMDGESLWAIRRNGWLELGFNRKYFENILNNFGWALTFHDGKDSPWSSAIIARRFSDLGGVYRFFGGGLQTQVGILNAAEEVITNGKEGYLVYGPYINLPKGRWKAVVSLNNTINTPSGVVKVDVVSNGGLVMLGEIDITLSIENLGQGLEIIFETFVGVSALEVRVLVTSDVHISVKCLEILYLSV